MSGEIGATVRSGTRVFLDIRIAMPWTVSRPVPECNPEARRSISGCRFEAGSDFDPIRMEKHPMR